MGKAEPKFDVVVALCKNFSVSSDWLFGLTDDRGSGISVTASGGSVAANNSTVRTGGVGNGEEVTRLLGIIESQQRVIEALASGKP